jgi:steroid delta-isomerase-like uncharacterized protein
MGIDDNKALVRRLVDEFLNQRKLDVVDEIFAEDFVDHQGALGPTGDRDSVKAFVTASTAAFPDARFEIGHLLAEGDLVFLRVIAQGTHRGEFGGISATGKAGSMASMSLVRVTDGKIAERWNITDFGGLMQQLTSPEVS